MTRRACAAAPIAPIGESTSQPCTVVLWPHHLFFSCCWLLRLIACGRYPSAPPFRCLHLAPCRCEPPVTPSRCSDCGDDGCGGSCGVCGADETCSAAHVCLSTAPLIPQAPVTYGSDSGGLAGSFFGGAFTAVACAGVAWFVRCGGRARFDRWRFAGGEGGSGAEGGDASSKLMSPQRSGATAAAASSGSAASAPLGGGGKFTTYGGV